MRQLLLPGALAVGLRVELSGDDYHYVGRVLRKRPGDRVPALDEAGNRWVIVIHADDGTRLLCSVDPPSGEPQLPLGISEQPLPPREFPPITLYQAIPKGRKLDEAIRQLVQAGVRRICPIVTERTVVRPESGGSRTERWRRIAREAVQQSGASYPVTVAEPCLLSSVQPDPQALPLVLHTQPIAQTTLHGYLADIPAVMDLVAGPEGGFSNAEVESLLGKGFRPVWLGPQVLRSESAALFAVAALRILIQERATWQPATQ